MRRRSLRILALAALLGAVTNILVTAVCVYGAGIGSRHVAGIWNRGDRSFLTVHFTGPGKAIFDWRVDFASDVYDTPIDRPPSWSTIHSAYWTAKVIDAPTRGWSHTDVAYGWPWLSFRGGILTTGMVRSGGVVDFGPRLPELVYRTTLGGSVITHREPRVVPLRPILPGLVLNSAVYGAAWWVLLLIPGAVRRQRRRRRGACVECGYDRRGIGADVMCPECGASASGGRRT